MQILKTFPYFQGKKLLYVHGFGSSGQSNTPRLLRSFLPEAEVIAPDLPIHPEEALLLLRETCEREKPAVIVGTSMGGMYAEMLSGYDRILVNPAFGLHETLRKNVGLGRVTFFNPRQDGVQEFMLTKSLLEEYHLITEQNFLTADAAGEQERVMGLFGRQDPLVHERPTFLAHYRQAVDFEGEHRLNDSILLHTLLPMLGRIDKRQTGRERPVVYIALSAMLRADGKEVSEASFAFECLAQRYDVYVIAPASCASPWYGTLPPFADLEEHLSVLFGVNLWGRLVRTDTPHLLYGDYLLAPEISGGTEADFLGTYLPFGSAKFKTWEDTLAYFELLGGQ